MQVTHDENVATIDLATSLGRGRGGGRGIGDVCDANNDAIKVEM